MTSCVLTLRLDDPSQAYFEELRQRHFPAERNLVPAHVTLFHTLHDEPAVRAELEKLTEGHARFVVDVTGLRSLGKGVAFTLSSPALMQLHSTLRAAFDEWMTAQDRQRFMPHIVVQNKVSGEQARTLLEELQKKFRPAEAEACGVDLWAYLGGPWQHLQTYRFQDPPPEPKQWRDTPKAS